MKNDVDDKEVAFKDVTNILSIIVASESLIQKKDEQVVLSYYEEFIMPQSESNAETSVSIIVFDI